MGENMKREMICVACPLGCHLTAEHEGQNVSSVAGNACKRGITYAETEIANPTRTLTTTVKVFGGKYPLSPVKSEKPVPKSLMLDCMDIINKVTLSAPIAIGDVVVRDILGTGVNIIATNKIPA